MTRSGPGPNLRDRLVLDEAAGELRDGPIRYLMMRHDVLMGLFAELPETQREPALRALGRSVRRHGGRSVAAYHAAGADDPEAMLRTIETTSVQLGWGGWTFRRDGAALRLAVRNSPFAGGAARSPHPVCHAIGGILEAMGPYVLGGPVRVEETRCAACGGDAGCDFLVAPASPPPTGDRMPL